MTAPLDLDLLRAFVAVVDASGFTRAADRLHLTQSTVSQQIKRLEDTVGRVLLVRERTGDSRTTEEGERLLGYARRMLEISREAQEALVRPSAPRTVRLGVPEDFAGAPLIGLLSEFARSAPHIRLDTESSWSFELLERLERDDLDLALMKRDPSNSPSLAQWSEPLVWLGGRTAAVDADPVALALFPPFCIYRRRALAAMEAEGRQWRIAYTSQALMGIQAAVAAGLGVSTLPRSALQDVHRVLTPDEGFPELPPCEVALIAARGRLPKPVKEVADFLIAHMADVMKRP
jgi:DNA-binding transcriptional LysR family regulator